MSVLARFLSGLRASSGKQPETAPTAETLPDATCLVCRGSCPTLDSIDFNKNCEEARGLKLPDSGIRIRYCLCESCGFCFAPEFASWSFRDFEQRIYNDDYESVDPDYKSTRPASNAEMVNQLFGSSRPTHVDYGGGSGLLSERLRAKGWSSRTFDPFVDRDVKVTDLGSFDLVTSFEVFEHVPDIDLLFTNLQSLVKPGGLILFSTLLSDGQIVRGQPLRWWYAAPRNGHISLYSAQSLRVALSQRGFKLASADANLHMAYRQVPAWARHILPAG